MILRLKELAVVLGGGVSLGLAVAAVSELTDARPNVQAPSNGASDEGAVERAALEANIKASERRTFQSQDSIPRSPEQELAISILSSPNATLSDIAMASQILNGQGPQSSGSGPAYATQSYSPATVQPRPGRSGSIGNSYNGYTTRRGFDDGPAHRSIDDAYGSGSASRGYSGAQVGVRQVVGASPVILNRAGPGTYSDGNGDIYAQAGPHGTVNTRTGEFSPTN